MAKQIVGLIICLWPALVLGSQEKVPTGSDSTEIVDTTLADTTAASRTGPQTILDSIKLVYPDIDPDTLTEPQRRLAEFETRFRLKQRDQVVVAPARAELSYYDSLLAYFVTPRWNLRRHIDASFYHDAGDYFKFNPGFVTLDHQETPMRKTVQPYGLTGDRLGVIHGGRVLAPFEHPLEPDGLMDMNDIPTAGDHQVAILPGPVGMILGGRASVATLLTMPGTPDSTEAETTFLVDKGTYAYAYTRGRYAKQFYGGRSIDAALGYRNADGPWFGRTDDAYYYTGDFYFPLGESSGLRTAGWLYDRAGPLYIRPDLGGVGVTRDRFDRQGEITWVRHNDERTAKYEVGYAHTRQSSNLDNPYKGRFNYTGNSGSLSREWVWGKHMIKTRAKGGYLTYDEGIASYHRATSEMSVALASLTGGIRDALLITGQYVEDFGFLTSAQVMFSRDSDNLFVMMALGHAQRAPSMHELYLRPQVAGVYGRTLTDYFDAGNPSLEVETQVIGSAEIVVGSLDNALSLSATGGEITNAIEWRRDLSTDGLQERFTPINDSLTFVTSTADLRLSISDLFWLHGGASFHYYDWADDQTRPFAPEYQAFAGGELHIYWSQKLIDLWAYGEVTYLGPYDGYVETDLGKTAVLSGKFSFRMGNFRFHWIVQNVLLLDYSPRDAFSTNGRTSSYGFTWDFLD